MPLAARLADPLTYSPFRNGKIKWPFPVLVVSGDEGWVRMVQSPLTLPPLSHDESYFVPPEKGPSIERYIREHDTAHRDSDWVLRVEAFSSEKETMEFFLMGDGYRV